MNNDQFLDKLFGSSNPLWIIVLCNILDGLDAKLYEVDFVRQAIEWWREDFIRLKSGCPTTGDDELLETSLSTLLLPENILSVKPSRPKPAFRLNCSVASSTQNCAHSMLAESFVIWVLHEDDHHTLLKDGSIGLHPPYFPNHAISPSVRIGSGKAIGKPGGVVFMTTFEAIQHFLSVPVKANKVRDRLGLPHWKKTQEFVLLEIQASELAKLPQGRPTFVDAGCHRRFQAVASDPVNHAKNDWGFTVDLEIFGLFGNLNGQK